MRSHSFSGLRRVTIACDESHKGNFMSRNLTAARACYSARSLGRSTGVVSPGTVAPLSM